jgi:hypothetical protein
MAERRQMFTGAHVEVPFVSKKVKILGSGDKKSAKKTARSKKQADAADGAEEAAPAEE